MGGVFPCGCGAEEEQAHNSQRAAVLRRRYSSNVQLFSSGFSAQLGHRQPHRGAVLVAKRYRSFCAPVSGRFCRFFPRRNSVFVTDRPDRTNLILPTAEVVFRRRLSTAMQN